MATILLVEDDRNLRYGLSFNLTKEGHTVKEAPSAEDAFPLLEGNSIDLVLLDVMLPGIDGLEFLERVRETNPTLPVMMLTARSDESDAVHALRLGADDYVRKPFGVSELMARIDAQLRRAEGAAARPDAVVVGKWTLDLHSLLARDGTTELPLTSTEAELLAMLHARRDEAVPRRELLERIWGVSALTPTRTLDNHVARLRKKLEDHPDRPSLLVTVHGVGYRLVARRP